MTLCREDIRLSLTSEVNSLLQEGKTPEEINGMFQTQVVGEDNSISIPEELIDKYWEANRPEIAPDSIDNSELSEIEKQEDQQFYDVYQEHGNVLDRDRSPDMVEESLDVSDSINENYPSLYSEVIVQGSNHNVIVLPKSDVPKEYLRVSSGNRTPQEEGSHLLNKVLQKMQSLFPDFKYHIIEQEEADRIAPEGTNVNSFIKDNQVYLVRGRFTPEMAAEEFLHPFVNHLFTDNSELANSLYRESITNYPELKKVFNLYKDKLGEEDATQEVVARGLSRAITGITDKPVGLIKRFITWLKSLFKRVGGVGTLSAKTSLQELAQKISDRELKMDYILKGSNSYNLSKDSLEDNYNRIKNIATDNGIRKISDSEGYVDRDGNKVTRITDLAKEEYLKDFGKYQTEQKAEKSAENEILAERGTQFHKDMENMFRLYIDPYTGKKNYSTLSERDEIDVSRFQPSLKTNPSFREDYVNKINQYVKDKLDTYSSDARFLFETVVYNKKEGVGKPVAGTVDFIAIDNTGIDILDWKSIYKLSDEGKIYGTKKKAFNKQLVEYYNAIKYTLGLSDNDFHQVRVIPILPEKDVNGLISSLKIGAVKPKGQEVISLLPILSEKDEKYKTSIKSFLDSVNQVLLRENARIKRETGVARTDYELKQELEEAIQQVATQQNPEDLFLFIDDILGRTDKYLSQVRAFEGEINEETIQQYSTQFEDADRASRGLSSFLEFAKENLTDYMNPVEGDTEGEKAIKEANKDKIIKYAHKINEKVAERGEIYKARQEWIQKVAQSQSVTGINSAQLEIGFLKKWTNFFTANPATKAIQLFSKLYKRVRHLTEINQNDAQIRSLKMKDSLSEWSKKTGKSLQDIYTMMIRPNSFLLQSKISQDFYDRRDEVFDGKDSKAKLKFFKDNYDKEAYDRDVADYLRSEFDKIEGEINGNPDLTEDRKNAIITRRKESLEKRYLITLHPDTALKQSNYFLNLKDEEGNFVYLKQDQWKSVFSKFLESSDNKPVSDFYEHLLSLNRRAKATGLMPEKTSDYFVPHVLKGLLETGTDIRAQLERYLTSIGSDPNSHQFGNIDLITKLPIEKMFLPFTVDLSERDKDGKKVFSKLSQDLQKSFLMFEMALTDVEQKQHLESFVNLLADAEQANQVINVNIFGSPQKIRGTDQYATTAQGTDSNNFKALNAFRKYLIYGQRSQNFTDKLLPTPFKDKEGKRYYVSAARVIQSVASFNRTAVLGGLNFVAPLRNYVMGRTSAWVQNSKYFDSTLSLKNYAGYLERFLFDPKDPRQNKIAGSLAYFLPDLLHTGKILDKVSLNSAWQILTPENMMHLMSASEEYLSIPIHLALMDNSTVRDGKIVNINDIVREEFRKKFNTNNIYAYVESLSRDERLAVKSEMKARTKEIMKTDSLWDYMEINDGTYSIKGVDRKSDSVFKIRDITHNILQNSTGTGRDFNLTKTHLLGQMLGMFRSWIPRTVQVRTGELNVNNNIDSYEEGRMRSLVKYISNSHDSNFKKFGSLLTGFVGIQNKKNVIDTINRLYSKKVNELQALNKIERASELSQEDFTRLYLQNIDSAYKDLRATGALMLMVATGILGAGGGGDDDTTTRLLQKELAKYSQEFTFYYNFSSALDMIKNPFPISGFYTNLNSFFANTLELTYNYDKAHPGKYFFKSLPLTSFFVQYLPLFNEQAAKDWNITVNKNLFNR